MKRQTIVIVRDVPDDWPDSGAESAFRRLADIDVETTVVYANVSSEAVR